MKNLIDCKLIDLVMSKRGTENDTPLDGDEVEALVKNIEAIINLHEGNITEEEFEELTKGEFKE